MRTPSLLQLWLLDALKYLVLLLLRCSGAVVNTASINGFFASERSSSASLRVSPASPALLTPALLFSCSPGGCFPDGCACAHCDRHRHAPATHRILRCEVRRERIHRGARDRPEGQRATRHRALRNRHGQSWGLGCVAGEGSDHLERFRPSRWSEPQNIRADRSCRASSRPT